MREFDGLARDLNESGSDFKGVDLKAFASDSIDTLKKIVTNPGLLQQGEREIERDARMVEGEAEREIKRL